MKSLPKFSTAGEVGILYKKLVTELGIASGVEASYDPDARARNRFFHRGVFARGAVSSRSLKKSLRSTLNDAAQKGLDATMVENAKQRLQRSAIFAREGLMMPGYAFGMAMTTGHGVTDVEAWPDRINAVTVEQVNAALRDLAASKRQIMGTLLPAPKTSAKKGKPAQPVPSNRERGNKMKKLLILICILGVVVSGVRAGGRYSGSERQKIGRQGVAGRRSQIADHSDAIRFSGRQRTRPRRQAGARGLDGCGIDRRGGKLRFGGFSAAIGR